MKKQYILMVTSFFLIFLFFFTGIWAFTEYIGDGSWNERIFVGSGIGVLASIATFIISVIWGFIKR